MAPYGRLTQLPHPSSPKSLDGAFHGIQDLLVLDPGIPRYRRNRIRAGLGSEELFRQDGSVSLGLTRPNE
jgi:hypothetical protein